MALDRLVEPAEGRSPVPGDQGRRVEAAAAIRAVLVEREAHEGLDAGHEDAAGLESILHLEGEGVGAFRTVSTPPLFQFVGPVTRNAKGARRPLAARPPPPVAPRVSGSRTRPGHTHTHRRSPHSPRPRTPARS